MRAFERLAAYQNLLPIEAQHTLMIIRRKKLWKKRGVIFIHIPKVAGVSINTALYGRLMGHFKAVEVKKYAPFIFKSLPSFAVTRNPWERCLSAYRFACAGGGKG